MKSAIYCGHANESPQYEKCGEKLVCACPEDCYCKHEGGCKGLRRELTLNASAASMHGHFLWVEDRLVASCTSAEALDAARRLMSVP